MRNSSGFKCDSNDCVRKDFFASITDFNNHKRSKHKENIAIQVTLTHCKVSACNMEFPVDWNAKKKNEHIYFCLKRISKQKKRKRQRQREKKEKINKQ